MKRFRPTISIRWMMALVLILGAPMGWYVNSVRAQRRAVEAVRGHGECAYPGEFAEDDADRPGWPDPPPWLAQRLGRDWFEPITWASLDENATDADLAAVARFGQLRKLDLDASGMTDEGFKHLAGLRNLRTLSVYGHGITDAGLAHLDLHDLRSLNLQETAVTDATLAKVAGCDRLASLTLGSTRITDEGLRAVAGLPNLGYLAIDHTAATDAGLAHLGRLHNLRNLWLSLGRITPEGVQRLQQAIPGLIVQYNP